MNNIYTAKAPKKLTMNKKCVHSRAWHAAYTAGIEMGKGSVWSKRFAKREASKAVDAFLAEEFISSL